MYRELLMKFRDTRELSFADPGLNDAFQGSFLYVEYGWISWYVVMGMIQGSEKELPVFGPIGNRRKLNLIGTSAAHTAYMNMRNTTA